MYETVSLHDEAVRQQAALEADESALRSSWDVLSMAQDAEDAPIDADDKANILAAADKVRELLRESMEIEHAADARFQREAASHLSPRTSGGVSFKAHQLQSSPKSMAGLRSTSDDATGRHAASGTPPFVDSANSDNQTVAELRAASPPHHPTLADGEGSVTSLHSNTSAEVPRLAAVALRSAVEPTQGDGGSLLDDQLLTMLTGIDDTSNSVEVGSPHGGA